MTKPKVLISDKMDPNAAHIFEDLNENLAIIEPLDARIDQTRAHAAVNCHAPGDRFGKGQVGVPCDQLGFGHVWHR